MNKNNLTQDMSKAPIMQESPPSYEESLRHPTLPSYSHYPSQATPHNYPTAPGSTQYPSQATYPSLPGYTQYPSQVIPSAPYPNQNPMAPNMSMYHQGMPTQQPMAQYSNANYSQKGAPSNQKVAVHAGYDAGARFNTISPPSIPPPPPGVAPNAAQIAQQNGASNVMISQKKSNFWTDGAGGGSTFW